MRTFWSLSLVFALVGTLANAQALRLPSPGQALYAFSRDARLLADFVTNLERSYPNAAIPLLKDVRANPEPWYHEHFATLLVQNSAIDATKTRIDWMFSQWPRNLAAVAAALDNQYRNNGTVADIQPIFFNVHDAYARSLAATYLLIEGIKRQYINVPFGQAFPSAGQRDFTSHQLVSLHLAAQRLVNWMYAFRCSTDFSFLFSLNYFTANEAFETRYRNNYFIGSSPDVVLGQEYDISYFLVPVATADEFRAKLVTGGVVIVPLPSTPAPVNPAPVNPAPVNPAPVNPAPADPAPAPTDTAQWQRDWDEVQKQLASTPDDTKLRQRLWDLEKQKKTLPAPAHTSPAPLPPTTNPSVPATPAPVVTSNPEIERVKKLLAKPEVQANADLKQQLEELLKSLEKIQQPTPVAPTPNQWASHN